MPVYPNHYEEILDYLKLKYKRITIGKKELSNELGIALSTLDLYMSKGICVPRYKKLGDKPNSRVIFNIIDIAEFLSKERTETM